MKKAALLYNPFSGDGKIILHLDSIIKIYQSYGTELSLIRLDENSDLKARFSEMDDIDHIIISGGDGTVNICINEMLRAGKNIPFGIIPTGTANDFAGYIGMPLNNPSEAVRQINLLPPQRVDLPIVNGTAFINVLSAGFFTDISQKTDSDLKNSIGKLAYYLKSIEMLRELKPSHVRVTTDSDVFEGEILIIMVFNGISTGTLKIVTDSKANDGLLDVIIIKSGTIAELVPPALGIIRGESAENLGDSVVFYRTKDLRVEGTDDIPTDTDGEKGPGLPLEVTCIKGGLTVLGISAGL